MADTYCGKNCAECTCKEALSCPGCKEGPGKKIYGDCELAKCCRDKGHEDCGTCSLKSGCWHLIHCEKEPEYRKQKQEEEQRRHEEIVRRAPFMCRWLRVLFWLMVPNIVASILTFDFISNAFPKASLAALILSLICLFTSVFALFKLSSHEEHYRKAAIHILIRTAAVTLFVVSVLISPEAYLWLLILAIVKMASELIATYHRYKAHEAVTFGVDDTLSAQWGKLWKPTIICELGLLICKLFNNSPLWILYLLMCIIVLLSIALFVIEILEYVYLYRTAEVYSKLSKE